MESNHPDVVLIAGNHLPDFSLLRWLRISYPGTAPVLLVENEPVLASAREVMKPDAQCAEEPLLPRHRTRFLGREEPRDGHFAPRATEARGTRDPQHGL